MYNTSILSGQGSSHGEEYMAKKANKNRKKPKAKHIGLHGEVLEEWQFPEYETHERTRGWFVIAGTIGMAAVVWAIWSANFLFALIIIMIFVIIITHHFTEPAEVEFQITDLGLQLGEHFYAYSEIDMFWIIFEPPTVKRIYFNFKNKLRPRLSIPLHEKNPLTIRDILLEYLEEDIEQEREPVSDALGRRWKL